MREKSHAWLADQTIAAKPGMSEQEREAARAVLTPGLMRWSGIGGALLGIPLAFALYALYYLLAAKFIGIGYGKWFALAVWASLPRLDRPSLASCITIGVLPVAVVLGL